MTRKEKLERIKELDLELAAMEKIEYCCPECGGTNIRIQGWLSWNKENQGWQYTGDSAFLPMWCDDCEEEIRGGLDTRPL